MKLDTKTLRKNFFKYSCSGSLLAAFDYEYDHIKPTEEEAASPLGGGMMQCGYQCGMLWGTSMGAGAEAYKRESNPQKAMAVTILTTQEIIDDFVHVTKSPDCYDITNIDASNEILSPNFRSNDSRIRTYLLPFPNSFLQVGL